MSVDLTAPVQRLDKWLWFARLVKSRTLAAQMIEAGKVRVNRERVIKPSHALRQGDVLTIALRGQVLVLKMRAAGTRRGPPPEARLLYERLDGLGRHSSQVQARSGPGLASYRGVSTANK